MANANLEQDLQESPPPPIQPAEYYEPGGVPIFRPTMDEFRNFNDFLNKIDRFGMVFGIVKVIPPKEWLDSLPPITADQLNAIRVNSAIKQHFQGQAGIYTQLNMPYRRKGGLKDWKDLSNLEENQPPAVERDVNVVSTYRRRRKVNDSSADSVAVVTNSSVESIPSEDSQMKSAESLETIASPEPEAPEATTITTTTTTTKSSKAPTPVWYDREAFLPDQKVLYTREHYKVLEKHYWNNLSFKDALYGADIPAVKEWNVGNLGDLLSKIPQKIPGVNCPYLYFGMWKSTFAWHVEDMDLYSINFIHFGAPKQWYVVPVASCERFERLAQGIFAAEHTKCPQFMRHKMYQIAPHVLKSHSIPVYQCVQEEGEFMITFPHGYHSGYNLGYNCAESINFALDRWIEIGKKAKPCKCVADSVRIDVAAFFDPEPPEPVLCVICGTPATTDLLPVAGATGPDTLLEGVFIHELCALAIPEVRIDASKVVTGFQNIPKARNALKCKFCEYRGGACVQCVKGKCVTAFHPTCAQQHGLHLERTIESDKSPSIEAFCGRHDPRSEVLKKRSKEEQVENVCKLIDEAFEAGSLLVWAKWSDSKFYYGEILEDYRDRRISKVQFFDGYVRAVPYEHLSFVEPPKSQQE